MTHRNTKQMVRVFHTYEHSTNRTIYDVYKNCSFEKVNAFEHHLVKMREFDGHELRIIGANIFTFSVGFLFEHPQTHKAAFCYITPNYTRFIYLDEIEQREEQK